MTGPKTAARGGVGNYVDRGSVVKDNEQISQWQDQENDSLTKDESAPVEQAGMDGSAAQPVESASTSTEVKEADLAKLNEKLNFDFGSAELKPDAVDQLKSLAAELAKHPDTQVRIEGYADAIGGSEANIILSKKRARAVKEVLIEAGVKVDEVITFGYGKNNPVSSNSNPSGRAQNRRVEIHRG